jgi:hypothetical protein
VVASARVEVASRLAPELTHCLEEELGEMPGAEPWRSAVLARAAELQRAWRDPAGDWSAIESAVAALAGLGEGSTPAGDDYLVGVLHALHHGRGQAPPLHPEGKDVFGRDARSAAARIAAVAAARTTSLSAGWLLEAGRGEASPRGRALLDAMTLWNATGDRGALAAVRAAARAVRRSGHTSGAFSLRGFLDTVAR